MSAWSIADAKARFSELVLKVAEGAQPVTKRNREVAVVISPEEYRRLVAAAERAPHSPMLAFLKAAEALREGEDLGLSLPERRSSKGRRDPFKGNR